MEHQGTRQLKTARLILRRFVMNDCEAMYRNWASDPIVTTYLRWPAHTDINVTKSIVKMWIDDYQKDAFYQWAIVLKDRNEPIGTIGVVDTKEEIDCLHIGYCIGQSWWNQGITTEAFQAVIDYLFQAVRANRIESQHDPRNPGSGRVMENCGLRYEGTLRQADISNQGIVDAAVYGILASDYHQNDRTK